MRACRTGAWCCSMPRATSRPACTRCRSGRRPSPATNTPRRARRAAASWAASATPSWCAASPSLLDARPRDRARRRRPRSATRPARAADPAPVRCPPLARRRQCRRLATRCCTRSSRTGESVLDEFEKVERIRRAVGRGAGRGPRRRSKRCWRRLRRRTGPQVQDFVERAQRDRARSAASC